MMSVKNKLLGNVVLYGMIALLAGAFGSVLTLLATSNLQVPAFEPADQMVNNATLDAPGLSAEVPAEPNDDTPERLDRADNVETSGINEALKAASEERAQLAKVLAQLTQQVETLESDAINLQSLADIETLENTVTQQNGSTGFDSFGQAVSGQDRIDTLVSAGVDLQSAQALQDRQDQFQLARLELFDQAEREGWADSEQFTDRLTELNETRPDLREELGDDAYDRYLFEAGRNNRVVIASIIPGSAAEIAGLSPGDVVMSYAGERIFSTNELQSATRSGVRGEFVAMNVDREGQRLFFDIQRGPMGVTLNREQQNPS